MIPWYCAALLCAVILTSVTAAPFIGEMRRCVKCTGDYCASRGATGIPGRCYRLSKRKVRCLCYGTDPLVPCAALVSWNICTMYLDCEWSFAKGECLGAGLETRAPTRAPTRRRHRTGTKTAAKRAKRA